MDWPRVAAAFLLTLALPGCSGFSGGAQGPCGRDVIGCRDGEAFTLDPDCDAKEPLTVSIGHGDGKFVSLAPGEAPEVRPGPSGGDHFVLGLRIDNPDPDHLVFEVEIEVSQTVGQDEQQVGHREAVFGDGAVEMIGGTAQIFNIVLLLDPWDADEDSAITASIRDTCDRDVEVTRTASP